MFFVPRLVAFDKNGRCVSAGVGCYTAEYSYTSVINLPTDHYDFIGPILVKGKTEQMIKRELAKWQKP